MRSQELRKDYYVGVRLRSTDVGIPAICDRLDMIFEVLLEILRRLEEKP